MENSKKHHNQLTQKICDKVSYSIGNDWRRFGRHLNVNEPELEHIQCDYENTPDKAMEVLKKWKQKIGDPTWEQLAECLATFQRKDILMEVEREFNLAPIAHQGTFF